MATPTLVLVDAGMVAGFRRSSLSLGQLHQALVHLHRQHPDVHVAVVADPSVKFDLQFQEAESGEASKDGPKLKLADGEANAPAETPAPTPLATPAAPAEKKPPPAGGGEVVTLDQFRKK